MYTERIDRSLSCFFKYRIIYIFFSLTNIAVFWVYNRKLAGRQLITDVISFVFLPRIFLRYLRLRNFPFPTLIDKPSPAPYASIALKLFFFLFPFFFYCIFSSNINILFYFSCYVFYKLIRIQLYNKLKCVMISYNYRI